MSKQQVTTVKDARKDVTPKPHIVFTGGGTGGHVIPCLAVITELRKLAPASKISYIGSHSGVERGLVRRAGLPYYSVATGKLRRYPSLANLTDALRVPVGIVQAVQLLRRLRPDAVFAKGGYVSVPVALAAGFLKIPLITHESDITPGLATKLTVRFANQVCVSFAETKKYLSAKKITTTGNPVRPVGSAIRGKRFLKFRNSKPILLITGGSTGAVFLNRLVAKITPKLAKQSNIVWLTGPNKKPKLKTRISDLRVFGYLDKEYPDVLAAASLVICRAGAGTLFELAAAGKPSVLIPLPAAGSRGDQLLNAEFFAKKNAAKIYTQESINPSAFATEITELLVSKRKLNTMSKAVQKLATPNAALKIAKLILKNAQ